MRVRWKLLLWTCLVLIALAAIAICIAWRSPRSLLCIDTGWAPADAIVVLGGDYAHRVPRAAELFRNGAAPHIITTGAEVDDSSRNLLVNYGVPSNCIEAEPRAKTTWENAKFTVPLLRAHGARRVIIVTSWYHSRRGLHCFQKAAPEMTFYSCPAYHQLVRSEWRQEGFDRVLRLEYLKTAYYWVRYGVWPFRMT